MHSYEHMLKEVEEKLASVQEALCVCESERSHLTSNLTTIKHAVDQSFKRHIGTLQCRSKWLSCHADSIYHLKEGSLSQQVAELELISNELKSCLDSSQYSLNKNEQAMELEAKDILENASHISLQPCESGSMVFVAHDNKLEEMIIGFGEIDAYEHLMVECDLLSDEGIFVVESPIKKADSIEMKVKSIEMHHLTAQSANSEKEDFERIEMDMHGSGGVNLDNGVVFSQPSQVDSGVEEGTESSKSIEWLHRPNPTDQVVPEETLIDSQLSNDISLDEKSNHVTDSTNKVPLWLKKCKEDNPWIRQSNCKGKSPLSNSVISQQSNSSTTCSVLHSKEVCNNMDHMNSIYLSSNSKFLRSNVGDSNSSVYSLGSDLGCLVLVENKELLHPRGGSSPKPTSIGHQLSDIFGEDKIFLRGKSKNLDANLDANPLQSMDSDEHSMISFSQDEVSSAMDVPSSVKSNISHMNVILDGQAREFLVAHHTNSQIFGNTYTRSTSAVNHMRNLENKPDRMFLRSGKTKTFNAEMCEWLRGSKSVENCMQCFDFEDCEMKGGRDSKWVKTATDW